MTTDPRLLTDWREQHGYSKAEAARRWGVDRSTWGRWESGEHRPSPVLLRALARDTTPAPQGPKGEG